VKPGGRRWQQPLPLQRTVFTAVSCRKRRAVNVPTCGHLFQAVQSFLQAEKGLTVLTNAVSRHLKQPVDRQNIDHLDVLLIKHGEFYHPCRIEVFIGGERARFVLNVAVSKAGLAQLETEYQAMRRLQRELPLGFFPRVYGRGTVQAPFPMAMFLAEWLNDFCEFHACRPPGSGTPAIVVWNPDSRNRTLYGRPVVQIYRQATAILAACYHPETFEQIHPWHHAAGDFVICYAGNTTAVRLVSARSYTPLFQPPTDDSPADAQRLILEALLVFLLQLSIRMRIDRLDGVGDLIWMDHAVVPATVGGFFDGLAAGCRVRGIPAEAGEAFAAYLSSIEEKDLLALCRQLAEVHLTDEEKTLAGPGLEAHCARLHAALQSH